MTKAADTHDAMRYSRLHAEFSRKRIIAQGALEHITLLRLVTKIPNVILQHVRVLTTNQKF